MMEILEFIFQDEWHFLGTFLLLAVVFDGIKGLFRGGDIIIERKKDDL
jgi:hypothetical protein